MMTSTRIGTALVLLLLAGCQTSFTRADTAHFKSMASATIQKTEVPRFADCILDGFQAAQSPLATTNVRQHRRSTGFRVESFAGAGSGMIMMSADIGDDWSVQLWESGATLFINTSGERKAFAHCLSQTSQ